MSVSGLQTSGALHQLQQEGVLPRSRSERFVLWTLLALGVLAATFMVMIPLSLFLGYSFLLLGWFFGPLFLLAFFLLGWVYTDLRRNSRSPIRPAAPR